MESKDLEHDQHRYAISENKIVDAQKLSNEQAKIIKKSTPLCAVCKEPVIAKFGSSLVWHFAHEANSWYRYHEPESDRHKKAKKLLASYSQKKWPEAFIKEEGRIAEIRQIADVLVQQVLDDWIALEIQYADLSPLKWLERHQGYQSVGINDVWILGDSRLRITKNQAYLDSLSTALIAERQSLLYLNPSNAKITELRVSSATRFDAKVGKRLGKRNVEISTARLKDLNWDGSRPFISL
jgi:competence CoiA-like predicted nuclease